MTVATHGASPAPAALPARSFERGGAKALVALLISVAVLAGAGRWLVFDRLNLDDRSVFALIAALPAALAVLALTLTWRRGVVLVLLYITVEGAVANLLFPATFPLLATDILLIVTYVGFLLFGPGKQTPHRTPASVLLPMAALTGLVALHSFNPSGVEPLVALVGARTLLLHLPLFVLGFQLGGETGQFQRLIRIVLLASVPITAFGLLQYVKGPEFAASLGAGFARSIWIIGPESTESFSYRPTSTFAWVSNFGSFLLFVGVVSFASLHALPLLIGWRKLAVIFAATGTMIILQSQRSNWFLFPVIVVATYLLCGDRGGIKRALPILVLGLVVALVAGRDVLANRLPPLIIGITTPASNLTPAEAAAQLTGPEQGMLSSSLSGRVAQFTRRFARIADTHEVILGNGTGTALGAARHVNGGEVPDAFESGWFIPISMFGLPGALVYVWLYAAVLLASWRGARSLPPPQRWVPTAIFAYLLATAAISGVVAYTPTNVYFWLFGGVLAGLARLPQPAVGGAAAAPPPHEGQPAPVGKAGA